MLGYLIKTVLVLLVGYVYPAFKCFKVLERNNEGIQGLSFWCKYWIIVALATVLEKFNEIISLRFPMLAELKPLFFMFLWHRRTQGAEIIYETLVRPWIVMNEAEIEDKLEKIMSGQFSLFYIKNFTSIGQSRFLQPIRHFISNSQSNTRNQTISPPEIVRPEPTAPPLPWLRRGFEHSDDPNIYQLYRFSDDEHLN